MYVSLFFFSSRRRHTRCALVTGVQTCALPISRANGRSLLVMPGGAYSFISIANEGVDIAAKLTAQGYTVFVLIYRLPGEGWSDRSDVPLQDAQRAMRVVRDDAARNGLDTAIVDALGFSAGEIGRAPV